MSFEDHFSSASAEYSRYRPTYPDRLFSWLASIAPGRRLAWDCGTGSGQAALALAPRFERVVASDASAAQIRTARQAPPNVTFAVWLAEEPELTAASVDLVTVAQALHWFDLDRFYPAVRQVLVPSGVIAAWCYQLFRVTPAIDDIVQRWYEGPLEAFWPDGRRHIDAGYATLPFPFKRLDAPPFEMVQDWDLERTLGYLRTWSAVSRYAAERSADAVALIEGDLAAAWGDPRRVRAVRWPLTLLVGHVVG